MLLGPNGAGKTTLICMITGQFKPVAGSIHFAGRDITGWAPDEIFQAGISRKFQVPNMYETLSVFDNIMVSLQGRRRVFSTLFQRLSGEERDRIWEILEFVELADKASDACRLACRMANASGSSSACSLPPIRSCCCSTSRPPE